MAKRKSAPSTASSSKVKSKRVSKPRVKKSKVKIEEYEPVADSRNGSESSVYEFVGEAIVADEAMKTWPHRYLKVNY